MIFSLGGNIVRTNCQRGRIKQVKRLKINTLLSVSLSVLSPHLYYYGLSRRHDGSLITDEFVCGRTVRSWSHRFFRTRHIEGQRKQMC